MVCEAILESSGVLPAGVLSHWPQAWATLKGMPRLEAMELYCQLAAELSSGAPKARRGQTTGVIGMDSWVRLSWEPSLHHALPECNG